MLVYCVENIFINIEINLLNIIHFSNALKCAKFRPKYTKPIIFICIHFVRIFNYSFKMCTPLQHLLINVIRHVETYKF